MNCHEHSKFLCEPCRRLNNGVFSTDPKIITIIQKIITIIQKQKFCNYNDKIYVQDLM